MVALFLAQMSLALVALVAPVRVQGMLSTRMPRPTMPCLPLAMSISKSELPPGIAGRVSFQTGGAKTAGQDEEIVILWKALQDCFATRDLAEAAVRKNSAVILPQLNSPTKIKGTYKLLVTRFGKKGAAEILEKNPGILVCTPGSLDKQSDEEILKAANLVAFLDENKLPIKIISGGAFLAIVVSIVYRIISVRYGLN